MARAVSVQKRGRDGRGWVRVSSKVADLVSGESDLSEWTDRELMHGRILSKSGDFKGEPPTLIPRRVYVEFARRQVESGFADMVGDLRDVVKMVREIALDPDEDSSIKLRAANMVLDRVLGKARESVDVNFAADNRLEYERILDEVSIDRSLDGLDDSDDDPGELGDGHVIDAEVIDDDDDWQDDPEFAEDDELRDGGQWTDDRADEWDPVA